MKALFAIKILKQGISIIVEYGLTILHPSSWRAVSVTILRSWLCSLSKLWSKRNMILIELLLIKIMPEMIRIFKRKVFTPGFPWFQSLVREQNRIPALQFILGVNSIKLLQVYMYLSLFLDSKPIATLANYIY